MGLPLARRLATVCLSGFCQVNTTDLIHDVAQTLVEATIDRQSAAIARMFFCSK